MYPNVVVLSWECFAHVDCEVYLYHDGFSDWRGVLHLCNASDWGVCKTAMLYFHTSMIFQREALLQSRMTFLTTHASLNPWKLTLTTFSGKLGMSIYPSWWVSLFTFCNLLNCTSFIAIIFVLHWGITSLWYTLQQLESIIPPIQLCCTQILLCASQCGSD